MQDTDNKTKVQNECESLQIATQNQLIQDQDLQNDPKMFIQDQEPIQNSFKELEQRQKALERKKSLRQNNTKFIKFLEANNWNLESLQTWKEWDELIAEQKKELEIMCQYEPLFREAQLWIKNEGEDGLFKVQNSQRFASLVYYKKFNEWLKNQKYYLKIKQKKQKDIFQNECSQTIVSDLSYQQDTSELMSNKLLLRPLSIVDQSTYITVDKIKNVRQEQQWEKFIRNCENSTYNQRCSLFLNEYNDDPIIFIAKLRDFNKQQNFTNIFSNLMFTILSTKIGFEQINLFIASCAYYNQEVLTEDQILYIQNNLLVQTINKLQIEHLQTEVAGFLKLLWINKIELDDNSIELVTNISQKCSLGWKDFEIYLTKRPFTIRRDITEILPKSGNIFRDPFKSVLKSTKGDLFIRVPQDLRKIILEICVFSCSSDQELIKLFMKEQSDLYLQFEPILQQANHFQVYEKICQLLINKSHLWYKNMEPIIDICQKIAQGILEQKITDCNKIIKCLLGNFAILEDELSKAKIIQNGSTEEIIKIEMLFKERNKFENIAQQYKYNEFNPLTQTIIQDIEKNYGRNFHNLQRFCINYVLKNIHLNRMFINFGLGNGKTLICIALSILLNKILQKPIIFLVKSQYLLYRDHKKFKQLIQTLGLNCFYQEYQQQGITFMDEKSFFDFIKHGQNKKKIKTEETILIIDEYDGFLFDDFKINKVWEKIKFLNAFSDIIGFSGSDLNQDESNCLKVAFNTSVIYFPNMRELCNIQIQQLPDIIADNEVEHINSIIQSTVQMAKKVPIILALGKNKINDIKGLLIKQQISCYDMNELYKSSKLAELQTLIDYQFIKKQQNQTYGVYIIDQEMGRGTDFPSSKDIEDNGGIFLIIGEIYGQRILEQMKGRISRMQNKGTWQYILEKKIDCSKQDYIRVKTNILDLQNQSNKENLLALLLREHNKSKNKDNFQQNKLSPSHFFQEEESVTEQFDQQQENCQQYIQEDLNITENEKISEDEDFLPQQTKHSQFKNNQENSNKFKLEENLKRITRGKKLQIIDLEESILADVENHDFNLPKNIFKIDRKRMNLGNNPKI